LWVAREVRAAHETIGPEGYATNALPKERKPVIISFPGFDETVERC
jgi:hypothetical protein